jgi:hypothetical protein
MYPFPYPVAKPPRKTYGQGHEAQAIKEELGEFAFHTSRAWDAITQHFGFSLRLREMKAMVHGLLIHIKRTTGEALPPLSRNAKRSIAVLVKYVDTYYDRLVPYFSSVTLCDDDKEPIRLLDAVQASDSAFAPAIGE